MIITQRMGRRRAAGAGLSLFSLLLFTIACAAGETDSSSLDSEDPGDVSTSTYEALEGKTIIRVEEDWIIDVAVTDLACTAPEIVTVFGPSYVPSGLHAVFEQNHWTYPSFERGGLQLQAWYGRSLIRANSPAAVAELATAVERIRYTCVTSIDSGRLTLAIENGDSVTWGQFGNSSDLAVSFRTLRSDLNHYDPTASLRNSRVTFGANRVNRFLRSEIRFYTDTGEVIVETEDAYVHCLAEADLGPAPINE